MVSAAAEARGRVPLPSAERTFTTKSQSRRNLESRGGVFMVVRVADSTLSVASNFPWEE